MTPEEQRMQALEQATAIRVYRSQLKLDMAAGKRKLTEVLRSHDPLIATMLVRRLVETVPGLGPKKVRRLFDSLHLSSTITVERLNVRRREELLFRILANHPSSKGRI